MWRKCKVTISATAILLAATLTGRAELRVTAEGAHAPVRIEPDRGSGLEGVYVVDGVKGLTIHYTASSGGSVKWYRFDARGTTYATETGTGRHEGSEWVLDVTEADMGYIAEADGRQHCLWLTNYEGKEFAADGIECVEAECAGNEIKITGKGARIIYRGITGRAIEIDRGIEVRYETLEYDSDRNAYVQTPKIVRMAYLKEDIFTEPTYCGTRYKVSGDRFGRVWGTTSETESGTVDAVAVTAHVSARQLNGSNDDGAETDMLGGSAPAEIAFSAELTDAAIYTEWQISDDESFDRIDYRYNDRETTHVFRESGTSYARFVCANSTGNCTWTSETYVINIGESMMKCPNAFSPDGDGVNDEWKVVSKSIVEFDCQIFDRHGREIAHLTSPDTGWDGRKGGKPAAAGVYYYVIRAKGSDGKVYNKSGDINIIGSRNGQK